MDLRCRSCFAATPGAGPRVRTLLLALGLASGLSTALSARGLGPLALESYSQELQVEFGDVVTAAQAHLEITPLYRDSRWAITGRFDDNSLDHLRVRDLLRRYGLRATFYLNESNGWTADSTHYPFAGGHKDLAKALSLYGNSVGGHTLSHNFVPLLDRQESFYELMGVRVDREVNSQSPISSFVFPFNIYRNPLEGVLAQRAITAQLTRAGYIHLADHYYNLADPSPFLDSWLLPCDGDDIASTLKEILNSEKQRTRDPSVCLCMHAWPQVWGGSNFPKLSKQMRRLAGRKQWWYANQNELAAYRYQALYSKLTWTSKQATLAVKLERPAPLDLGDEIPLSLKVNAAVAPKSASLDGLPLSISPVGRGVWLLELPQRQDKGLPQVYEAHHNPSNQGKDLITNGPAGLSGVASLLRVEGSNLLLTIANLDKQALAQLRLRLRLPPLFVEDSQPRYLEVPKKGGQRTWTFALTPSAQADVLDFQGRPYFVAQLDFVKAGRRVRLYSDCRGTLLARDPSLPRGGFVVLGPLSGKDKDPVTERQIWAALTQNAPGRCVTTQGGEQCWRHPLAAHQETLHPELVATLGLPSTPDFYTWDPAAYSELTHPVWLAATWVECPTARRARVITSRRNVTRLYINGARSRDRWIKLKAGRNLIGLLYDPQADGKHAPFSEKNYGPFFRLADEKGKRLNDLSYQAPPW